MKIHDYRREELNWNKNILFPNLLEGEVIKCMGWGYGINKGDFILLSGHYYDTWGAYEVMGIEYTGDPRDLFHAEIKPAPDAVKNNLEEFEKIVGRCIICE